MQIRDWLYVEDNCRAIELVLERGVAGEVYNIGGGCERRNIEVVEAICRILAEGLKREPGEFQRRSSTYGTQGARPMTSGTLWSARR